MRLLALPVAALGLLVAPLAGPAAAAPPVETSGTYTSVITSLTEPEVSGNVAFFAFSNATVLSGSYTGTGASDFRCLQVGAESFRCLGDQTFSGTVAGVGSGTLVNKVRLTCDLVVGECTSTSVNISGTGDLTRISAVSHSRNVLGEPFGTYEGRLVVAGG